MKYSAWHLNLRRAVLLLVLLAVTIGGASQTLFLTNTQAEEQKTWMELGQSDISTELVRYGEFNWMCEVTERHLLDSRGVISERDLCVNHGRNISIAWFGGNRLSNPKIWAIKTPKSPFYHEITYTPNLQMLAVEHGTDRLSAVLAQNGKSALYLADDALSVIDTIRSEAWSTTYYIDTSLMNPLVLPHSNQVLDIGYVVISHNGRFVAATLPYTVIMLKIDLRTGEINEVPTGLLTSVGSISNDGRYIFSKSKYSVHGIHVIVTLPIY